MRSFPQMILPVRQKRITNDHSYHSAEAVADKVGKGTPADMQESLCAFDSCGYDDADENNRDRWLDRALASG